MKESYRRKIRKDARKERRESLKGRGKKIRTGDKQTMINRRIRKRRNI